MMWLQNYLASATQQAQSNIASAQITALANYLNPYAAPVVNVQPQVDLNNLIREAALFLATTQPNTIPAAAQDTNLFFPPSESFAAPSFYDEFEPVRKKPKMMEEITAEEKSRAASIADGGPTLRPPAEPVVDLVNFPDYKDVLLNLGLGKHLQGNAAIPATKPKVDAPMPKSILKSSNQASSSTPSASSADTRSPQQTAASTAAPKATNSSASTASTNSLSITTVAPDDLKKSPISAPSTNSSKLTPTPTSSSAQQSNMKSNTVSTTPKQPPAAPKQPPKQAPTFSLSNLLTGVPPKAPVKAPIKAPAKTPAAPISIKNVDKRIADAQAPHPMALERPIVAYVHGSKVGVNLRQKAADLFFVEYLKRFGEQRKLKAVNAALKYELRAYYEFPTEGTYRVQTAHWLKALRDGKEKRTDSDEE
jgi:hypothetical protein